MNLIAMHILLYVLRDAQSILVHYTMATAIGAIQQNATIMYGWPMGF